jgi:hypothetical protein
MLWLSSVVLAVSLAGSPAPAKPTRLRIEIQPQDAVAYVDGVKRASGHKVSVIPISPGRHMVKTTYKKDSAQEPVMCKKGETTTYKYAFEDDRATHQPVPESTESKPDVEGATPPAQTPPP